MSNFFDDDDDDVPNSPGGGSTTNGNDSFFTQPSPPRPAGRVSSVSGRAGTSSSLRASSRARRDSVSLEEILGEEVGGSRERSVQRLIRAWNNEIAAPELLHFPVELVETVVRNLAERKAVVRDANKTPGREEAYYVTAAIVATENMRAAHVLKSFTRERIFKIEQFAQYYLEDMEDARERMYHNELFHAEGILRLEETYYRTSCIDAMPGKVQRLDEPHMVAKPDLSLAVFAHALKDCDPVVLPDGAILRMEKGEQHMLRYSTVREVLRRGQVELI